MKPVALNDELQAYLDRLVPPRDPVLSRMEDEAREENIPIVDVHEGALLTLLIRIAGATRLLELGTATGYSGICMLRGTTGGSLVTYELDPARAERARTNFAAAGYAEDVQVLEEDAVLGLERLESKFDACFIDLLTSFPSDAVTRRAFELCLERLVPGSLLMADNVLSRGEVLNPARQPTKNVVLYNRLVATQPRLEAVVVPIRDGLSVARVRD